MRPRIAVATGNRHAPSETFIRAHVTELPAEVHFMTGPHLPSAVSVGLSGEIVRLGGAEGPSVPDVAGYLRGKGIAAVLAEYGPWGVAMAPACAAARVPLAVHFFGYDAYRHDVVTTWGDRYPELFDRAAAVIAISRPMREHLLSLGAPREKTYHSPCGYDPRQFFPDVPAGKKPPVFLSVSRLVEKKGPVRTIQAFAMAKRAVPEATLVLAGAGPLESVCRDAVRRLGLESSVSFKGAVAHFEVARLMREARVFVQHSFTTEDGDREGTPLAIIEASGSGLPVVATRHEGIPDVVADRVSGFLVDEGDIERMAERMIALARDHELATAMGAAASERATADFTLEICIARLWRILSHISLQGSRE